MKNNIVPMKERGSVYRFVALCTCTLFVSCGGGGGSSSSSSSSPPPTATADAGGIWMGTDTSVNESVVGIITESGNAEFIDSSGIQYVGTLATSGSSTTVNIQGFPPLGGTFADGSTHGSGTVTGTLIARQSFNGNTTFTTDKGTTYTGALMLTFNTLYDVPSSLSTIAGNYTDSATGDVVTIDANGSVFSQSPTTRCVVNGMATIVDASYNAYQFQLTYSNCEGTYAIYNGLTVTGLGTFDNAVSPIEVIGGAIGSVGGVEYGITYVLKQS